MDYPSLFRVDGLVAVITGGGTGLGLMMAKAFAAAGAKRVYIVGRREEKLKAAASNHPSVIIPVICDVTSKASLQEAVDLVTKEIGYVNLVVANAGNSGPMVGYNPNKTIKQVRESLFDGVSMEQFTQTLHENLTSAYYTMIAFLELLDAGNKKALEGGYGKPLKDGTGVPAIQSQVIFIGSIGCYSRFTFTPPAYMAAKSATVQLAKHAATSLASYQIRVNIFAPGFFPSEMTNGVLAARDVETEPMTHPMYIPARRVGTEEETAGTILYLVSRAGSYCNGSVILHDGGRLSMIPSTY